MLALCILSIFPGQYSSKIFILKGCIMSHGMNILQFIYFFVGFHLQWCNEVPRTQIFVSISGQIRIVKLFGQTV